MKPLLFYVFCAVLCLCACTNSSARHEADVFYGLEEELAEFVADKPGKIGVAVIADGGDTLTVNNSDDYPLMSMFKLHQAIAVSRVLDVRGIGFDTVVRVDRSSLDPDTWSPMLKEHDEDEIVVSVGELLDYILVHSDNNASNILFDRVASVASTDSIVRNIVPAGRFRLLYTESEMKAEHGLAYANVSSPLAYAVMVSRLFTDSVVSASKQEFIKDAMRRCSTGESRIAAGLGAGAVFAHRTGSGYINDRGEVVAVNDGGYVLLPDGGAYTIVVMVKDFAGPQADADKLIAEVSRRVYGRLANAASTASRSSSSCLSRLMMVPSGPNSMMQGMPVMP